MSQYPYVFIYVTVFLGIRSTVCPENILWGFDAGKENYEFVCPLVFFMVFSTNNLYLFIVNLQNLPTQNKLNKPNKGRKYKNMCVSAVSLKLNGNFKSNIF